MSQKRFVNLEMRVRGKSIFCVGVLVLLILSLGACVPRAQVPMRANVFGTASGEVEEVVLLLPGRGDSFGVYQREGFLEDLNRYWPNRSKIVFVEADAHLGYYYERVLIERLKEDVLESYPNAKISIIGVSLGGLGALLLTQALDERMYDVLAIAPYLGEKETVETLLSDASPPFDSLGAKERMLSKLWQALKDGSLGKSARLEIACGDEDYLKPEIQIAQRESSAVHFSWYSGGHTWRTWRPIWQRWMKRRAQGL